MLSKLVIATLIGFIVAPPTYAQDPAKPSGMSLEDLLSTQVTSVSQTQQKLSPTPSAIYVITQEQIQHSGALNIPDLPRMVPGMDAGQINANSWAISARGLNELWQAGEGLSFSIFGQNRLKSERLEFVDTLEAPPPLRCREALTSR